MFMPKLLLVPVYTALLLAFSALPALGQAADHEGQQPTANRPLMSAAEMTTTFFRPMNLNTNELVDLARSIHGRAISIEEKGGYFSEPVINIQQIGQALLIYEDAASAQRIVSWCRQMDETMKSDEPLQEELTVTQWRPRNISLMTGYSALSPFHRKVVDHHNGRFVSENQNLTLLKEQGTLVLRDTERQVEAMVALLERIDEPEEQLMLTALVITGEQTDGNNTGNNNDEVPADLAQHLSQLVPFNSFRIQSLGMVRTSARAREVEIIMDESSRLRVEPEVFDTASSTLTAQCEFSSTTGLSFETRTAITAGEYTVLGASGNQPLFCVLRIERLH